MHRLPVYKQMNYITNYETNQLLLLVVFKKNKKYYDLVIRIFKYIQYSKQFNIHIAPIRPKNFFRSVSKFFLIFFFRDLFTETIIYQIYVYVNSSVFFYLLMYSNEKKVNIILAQNVAKPEFHV